MLGLRHTVLILTGVKRTSKQVYVNVESSCSMSFVRIDRRRKSVEMFGASSFFIAKKPHRSVNDHWYLSGIASEGWSLNRSV